MVRPEGLEPPPVGSEVPLWPFTLGSVGDFSWGKGYSAATIRRPSSGNFRMTKKTKYAAKKNHTAPYKHPEAKNLMRPEVGTQAQFKKKKPPKTYRYDSSLSPSLDW